MSVVDFAVRLSSGEDSLPSKKNESKIKKTSLVASSPLLANPVKLAKTSLVYVPVNARKVISKNVIHHPVAKFKESVGIPKSTQKSHSVGQQALGWLVNTRVAHLVVLKSAVFLNWLGQPSAAAKDVADTQLNEITGSLHASRFLQGLSPWIAGVVKEKCLALDVPILLKNLLVQEPEVLPSFVLTLLPHLYCNIAHKIRECRSGSDEKMQPVTLSDVIAFLTGIVSKHLPGIQGQLQSLEVIHEEKERDKIIQDAFSGIVQEFLDVALPNGIKDLPLPAIPRLSQYFWKIVKKQVLPKISYELYRQMNLPMQGENKHQLLQRKGGALLVSLAQIGGRQSAELIPSLIAPKRSEEGKLTSTPIVNGIVKSLCAQMTGSDQLKTWTASWLTTQIYGFSSYKGIQLQELWKLLGAYSESLILHVLANLSKQTEEMEIKADAIGVMTVRLLSVCSRFINANQEKIQERLEFIRNKKDDPKHDPELLLLFQPLADDVLGAMGLHQASLLPVPDFAKVLLARQIKEMAPGFLLEQYCAMANASIDDRGIREQLRTLLFDPKHLDTPIVAVDVITTIYKAPDLSSEAMFEEFYRNLWRASGTEQLATTLEEMCSKVASGLVDSSMKHLGVAEQLPLHPSRNPMMKIFDEKAKALVKTALLEALVHQLSHMEDKVPKDSDAHPKAYIAANTLFQLHAMASKKLAKIQQELSQLTQRYPERSEAYMKEANKLFNEFAADLHAFIGINPFKNLPLDGLPGGSSMKESLWSSIKTAVLPALLRETYQDLTRWESKIETHYNELEKLYHTSHPKWASKVLAQYSTDFIRHYLQNSSGEVANLIIEGLGLKALKGNGEAFLSQNMQAAVTSEDPDFNTLWPVIGKYAEAIFAKVFSGISKTIQNIELTHPDLMVDIAIQCLKETADHFAVVTKVTEEWGVDQAFQVPLDIMLAAFGDRLHPGVPVKPNDPENVKDKVRLEGCFVPLADKLLKLSNLSLQDFPVPSALQKTVGELILNKIFPLILMKCYQKACEPKVRNVLMLHFVQTLYAALNGVKPPKKEQELQEVASELDSKKKQLYETCGSVVLELVKLIPDTTVQYVFMKEKVKNMSAQAIGNAIMPYLSRWSLLHIIDSVIYSGLPNFHPAKWEGKQGREDLIPRKISVRPDGKLELKPVKVFKFHFNSTSEEIARYEQQKALEAAKVRKELRDGFTKTISQQLYEKLWAFIRSLWDSMQGQLNDFIERMFPYKGRDTKAVLDQVFRRVFFDILGTILVFTTTPLVALVKFAIEKMIIDRRSENIIENLQTETLESLVYKWSDSVFDALARDKMNLN